MMTGKGLGKIRHSIFKQILQNYNDSDRKLFTVDNTTRPTIRAFEESGLNTSKANSNRRQSTHEARAFNVDDEEPKNNDDSEIMELNASMDHGSKDREPYRLSSNLSFAGRSNNRLSFGHADIQKARFMQSFLALDFEAKTNVTSLLKELMREKQLLQYIYSEGQ